MRIIIITVLIKLFFLSNNVYSKETFLSCRHEVGSTIVLSFDNENKIGKEYIGNDTQITYDLVLSEANLFLVSDTRSWNIDRFSGVSNLNSKNADGSWHTVRWICKKSEKIL